MLTTITNVAVGEADSKPTTQLSDYDFNSYCKAQGDKYLACGSDGIYEIAGDTYDGAPIAASIEFATTNFGTLDAKRTIALYFSGDNDGALQLATAYDNNAAMPAVTIPASDEYTVTHSTKKVKLAEGQSGVNCTFTLTNVDGADFVINKMDILAAVLGRHDKL